ncbi:hypothetical protein MOOTH_26740 [Moorella thermoacetica]|uniref:Uncharacterized protein n=1 Tax=Neomoorella thermoacetica TaxID=1525 RepID=A0A1J5JVW7_NEOTH|nr:hypothetical protein MOOR_26750 [Moorella thermoacetica]OIQ10432.1 hypothetical protein MOOTH_26740 [Moorella thermoacetica]
MAWISTPSKPASTAISAASLARWTRVSTSAVVNSRQVMDGSQKLGMADGATGWLSRRMGAATRPKPIPNCKKIFVP